MARSRVWCARRRFGGIQFKLFNEQVKKLDSGIATLKVIMEQHRLGMADLPEIGSKSLVSRILRGERRLTRDHIEALSKRFNLSPALFFQYR